MLYYATLGEAIELAIDFSPILAILTFFCVMFIRETIKEKLWNYPGVILLDVVTVFITLVYYIEIIIGIAQHL